jgi:hypothetical protein
MRVTEIIADLQLTDLEAAKDVHTGYLGLTVEGSTWGGWRGSPPRRAVSTFSW